MSTNEMRIYLELLQLNQFQPDRVHNMNMQAIQYSRTPSCLKLLLRKK